MDRTCSRCGKKILRGRIEAIPDTEVCAGCSDARAKTAADVDIDGPELTDLRSSARTPDREK